MSPFTESHAELEMLVGRVALSAKRLEEAEAPDAAAWEQHFACALADLWMTLDRIHDGLGLAFLCAVFPPGFPWPQFFKHARRIAIGVDHDATPATEACATEGAFPR